MEPTADTRALFAPLQIGTMQLRNRIMLPPHGRLIGNPFGSEDDANRFFSYFLSRAQDGAAWIGGLNCYVGKPMVAGFEPGGIGARRGEFRLPNFHERAARYADLLHAAGACATGQLTVQGGMPYAPSDVLVNYSRNILPRQMNTAEIEWMVAEYAFSAGALKAAGLDGLELHANHDDLLQLFLSPATNRRTDRYGGDLDGRLRFVEEILDAIRATVGADFTIGVRLNMQEPSDEGYDVAGGIEIARRLERTGHVDYISCVIGNNWGAPSYIQPHQYAKAQWSATAGLFKQALGIPVVYTGLVNDPAVAADVIARGHADVVGIARAMFADGEFVSKARSGRSAEVRPCIGTNDCIHRVLVEGLRFGCSVNPRTGQEGQPAPAAVAAPKRILVVGAGPAGLELSALLAERGHEVLLWEKEHELGGQMRIAGRARENAAYGEYLAFQAGRLERLGVDVSTGREATPGTVLDARVDVLAVATGARARRPDIPGAALPIVFEGRDVLAGTVTVGQRVVVIAMEDHLQPLTIAGFLADLGRDVRVLYQSSAIAPLVGPYSIGAPLATLSQAGAEILLLQRVVGISADRIATRNIYSDVPGEVTGFDSVVLACGGVPNNQLYEAMQGAVGETYLLGDAYAPRRISFATRQAYALAVKI